jgi:ATP-dependent Clp protease ATP-binding subunit ClpC
VFERFGENARYAVVRSQEQARLLDHDHIGDEHLLLALTYDDAGLSAAALASFGVTLETAGTEVAALVPRQSAPAGHIPFTPAAKAVLEGAVAEAEAQDRSVVRAEHLLLALLERDDGVAAQVLAALGADRTQVRERVLQGL